MVNRYVDAWERCDVEAFAAMLTEDATFAMPPLATWYQSREGIATWAGLSPLSGGWRWRTVGTRANGQPALAFYAWDEAQEAYLPFALNVLTLRGGQISDVTAFIVRSTEATRRRPTSACPSSPPIRSGLPTRSGASAFPSGSAEPLRAASDEFRADARSL